MIIERTEHPGWLSNAYLLADRDGGHGVLVDSNGINEPLLAAAERLSLTITHVLVTHHHEDHVVTCAADAARFGVPVLGHPLAREAGVPLDGTIGDGDVVRSGELELRVIETPGHCRDHLALLAGEDCLTGDCLFAGTVGGTAGGGPTGYADQVRSIMERLMALPPRDAHPPRPRRARRRSPPSGSRTRSSASGGGSIRRARSAAGSRARRRRSSSGAPTTTAPTRPGCATRTAATRSSAAPASSGCRGGS